MALTVRYFSTSGAGAADGTTWADRAALFSAGNWSTALTGFDFSTNAMEARVEGGLTYTCAQALVTGLFANPPTIANFLLLHGCDSSGNRLSVPDPNWVSAQPAFTDTTLPVINSTTNIAQINITHTHLMLLKHTASGRNGAVISGSFLNDMNWCVVTNSTANTASLAVAGNAPRNCVISCTGSSYSAVLSIANGVYPVNVRIVGNAGSSGNRDGLVFTGTTTRGVFDRLTIINNGGRGWAYTGTNVGVTVQITASVFSGNAGDQILFPNTASQAALNVVEGCMVTGGSAFGVNPGGANTHLLVTGTRLRDNASGNFGTFGNYPTDLDNYTTDAADADDYVDVGAGDYRIKSTAAIWGMGFGVADEAGAGSGGMAVNQGLHAIESGITA